MRTKFAAVNSAKTSLHLFPRSSQEPPNSPLEALCLYGGFVLRFQSWLFVLLNLIRKKSQFIKMKKAGSHSIGQVLRRWRIALTLATLTAIVASFIFSLPWIITPKYESQVIMYPASTSSLSSTLLSDLMWAEEDLLEFGERQDANQLNQVLESPVIREQVIVKFNLWEHYRIDRQGSFPQTRLWKEYEENVRVRINEHGAIELKVRDKDPQLAADIANKIAELLDSSIHTMQAARAQKAEQITLAALERQRTYVAGLEDSLYAFMRMGVNDYESQAQVIYEELAVQIAAHNQSAVDQLEKRLDALAEPGGAYVAIREELMLEKERLAKLKARYEKAQMDASQQMPQKFIIDNAYRAERKAYPAQWLIVGGTALSTFLFCLILLWLIESSALQQLRKRLISSEYP